jgi:hypothetical protein
LLLVFFLATTLFAQKIEIIKLADGTTLVRNPKAPVPQPGGPSELILKEDLIVGKQAGSTGPLIAQLRSVGVDDLENIWTLDWQDNKIRIFDKSGKLINTFGKKGQGPKELQNPSRMAVTGDGTALILDLNKIAFYSSAGECLKEISTAKARPYRLKTDGKSFIYMDSMDLKPPKSKILKVTKFDANLNPVSTLGSYEEPLDLGAVSPMMAMMYFHATKDGRLFWLVTSEYEFHVYDAAGKPIRKIVKDYPLRKITTDDQKRLLKERYGDTPPTIKITFPETYPPVEYFIGDDEGRLYARTYETDGKGGLWHDVFDTEGRCITRFSLPAGESTFVVKKGKLYTLIPEDEDGIPLVKRYAMEWK